MEILTFLAIVWGSGWSLVLEFAPRIGERFAALSPNARRATIFLANLLGVALITLIECGTQYTLGGEVACNGDIVQDLINAGLLYVAGVGSSLGTHYISPRKDS